MLETGVPNLDLILGGGLLEGDTLLVIGRAGSGKTTMTIQIAFHLAASGRNVLYVTTASEPSIKLMRHLRPFAFFDESLVGDKVILLSIYPLVEQSLEKVADSLIEAAKQHNAALVVVDGLATIRDLYPQAPELRRVIYRLGATLATLGCTLVLTSSAIDEGEDSSAPELTIADGVVELGRRRIGGRVLRTIEVSKMRGMAPLLGQHSLGIDNRGVSVYPRIESVFAPVDVGISREREQTGLPEFDAMAHGGFPVGSVTILAGAFGTGKTLLGLEYIMEGVRRGESGLFVSFRETPRQLIDKARSFGMDLETPVREGRVTILSHPQVDLGVNEVTWEIWQEVERLSPRRLVLESIAELEYALVEQIRERGYVASLAGLLRSRGVTSLITKEIAKVVGPELDFSDTPLASLAENLVLMRYVEVRSELLRIISILKMRDSAHDHSIRQYTITDKGLAVLAKLDSVEGLLAGIARLSSESIPGRRRRNRREEE